MDNEELIYAINNGIINLSHIQEQIEMKKNNELTEDDQKSLEEELQKLTDKRCKEVDELVKKKDQEIIEL